MDFSLNPAATALVLIDLQNGITALSTQPRSSADVVARANQLLDGFHAVGATVVLVHVAFPSGPAALKPSTDNVHQMPNAAPAGWADFVPELKRKDGDIAVLKRQWGAFYGTDLDLQLRRRGIETIVLAGIATNVGVESTARDAFERGYNQVFVEDACTDLNAAAHEAAYKFIFPRMGRVRSTEEVLGALKVK